MNRMVGGMLGAAALLFSTAGWGASILVGLDADLSSGSARSGESIRRGALLAMEEINRRGGVLGRSLQLVARDHRGNPSRGIDNIDDFSRMEDVVAVMGGLHTPVAMKELKTVHENQIPFLVPWAAGTPVIANGYTPNYAFRVSVRDQYAGEFLVKQAVQQGQQKIGLLLERTGWGRSNQKAMTAALAKRGLEPAVVEWFHWGDKEFLPILKGMQQAGTESILLVANAPEGVEVVRSVAQLPPIKRPKIFSHWGITGGSFFEEVGGLLEQVDLQFLQTYSFIKPHNPDRAAALVKQYCEQFGCESGTAPERSVFAPTGTAHAYDLIYLLAMAIQQAGSVERNAVRDALERIPAYRGLVRDYRPPFTADHHDALSGEDFRLARYAIDGVIIPVE